MKKNTNLQNASVLAWITFAESADCSLIFFDELKKVSSGPIAYEAEQGRSMLFISFSLSVKYYGNDQEIPYQ